MLCFLYIILVLYPSASESAIYRNDSDLSDCSVYYSRNGSVYTDFFEFNDQSIINNNGSNNNSLLLDFHFAVLASSDAHILFSPSKEVHFHTPVYEIVIGAGGNTFCDIRRMVKSAVKATRTLKNLLSALDPKYFWIHIYKGGLIEIGKEGEQAAFLSWNDTDPLPLKYFGFSTWPGIEAKWYFNCPHKGNIQRPLTPLEQLRRDLLMGYDPYVRPVAHFSNITSVGLRLGANIISLDERKSHLTFKGSANLGWQDEKLKWNSQNYSGIDKLHIFRREIWVPSLHLFNAVSNGNDILEDTMVIVNSTGYVNWMTSINSLVWCNLHDLGNWPHDEHTCDLLLGFYTDFDTMQLEFRTNESSFSTPYTSDWHVSKIYYYTNVGWSNVSDNNTRSYINFDPPILNIYFTMRRISQSYNIVAYPPFIVIAISLLVTFWCNPFSHIKLSLACVQLILASFMVIGLNLLIPAHSKVVPKLVLLYSYSLVATIFCVLIEIVVINFSRLNHSTAFPHIFKKTLTSFTVKMFLCLPDIKQGERYGNLHETKMGDNPQAMWILLGVVIDRIAFFVYLGLAVYALCTFY